MIQPTNSWSCPIRLLSSYAETHDESVSSLDPLINAEAVSGPLWPMFSTGRYSLVTPFATV